MKLYIVLTALALLLVSSVGALAETTVHEITVVADTGDTMWDICEPHCPEGMDLRLFIDKVMWMNDLESSALSIGQELIIPVD